MKRYYVVFIGRVQGVGFRAFVKLQAQTHHCTGWVRNMSNLNVEAEIQGSAQSIAALFQDVKIGNMFIQCDEIASKEISVHENETLFEIRY